MLTVLVFLHLIYSYMFVFLAFPEDSGKTSQATPTLSLNLISGSDSGTTSQLNFHSILTVPHFNRQRRLTFRKNFWADPSSIPVVHEAKHINP